MFSRQFHAHLLSPAKLNLGLSIVGKRSDGYHLLESLFWPISWGDEITVSPSTGNGHEVQCDWHEEALKKSELPSPEKNLVTIAVNQLDSVIPDLPRLKIEIEKRIPVGSGLGGGSSNAGSLLGWVAHHYPRYKAEILSVATRLGADVSFFLDPAPSLMGGIGEIQFPLAIDTQLQSEVCFLLVIPNESCVTREVFNLYARHPEFSATQLETSKGFRNREELSLYLRKQKNDLTHAAESLHPRLKVILSELVKLKGIYSGMTGSGSTCFSVFFSREEALNKIKGLSSFCRENNCKSLLAGTYNA